MRLVLLALLLVGCKSKSEPKRELRMSNVIVDMGACSRALASAASAPFAARPQMILDGCRVCGADWKPLLAWNTEPSSGGPRREQIEELMVACDAFCTGDSKLKFMAALDKARGQNVNTPWRQLENLCKARVNGAGDDRFMSAPFFALDRIARKAAAFSTTKDKLASLEIPLPAVSVGGVGVVLPDADGVSPNIGNFQLTVLGDAITIGTLPRGKLTHHGVTAELGPSGYPGEQVKLEELGAKLRTLVGEDKTQTITILAPHAMPAEKLVPIIAAAAPVAPVYLGANAVESPEGWQLPAAIPISLEAGGDIGVTAEMTVQNLARELATRAARKETRVGVTKK